MTVITQPIKSHYTNPSLKEFSPCRAGTCRKLAVVTTPNCNSLLTPNKLIFAGVITGSLFVLGQELKYKNYPLTSYLTNSVAGGGRQVFSEEFS